MPTESTVQSVTLDLPAGIKFPCTAPLTRISETPWAMLNSELRTLLLHVAEPDREPPVLKAEEVTDYVESAPVAKALGLPRSSGTVAVVPAYGVIDSKRIYYADVFTEELSGLLANLVANEQIGSIVLDVDSPGGAVYGVPELADQIRSYRGVKSIYAVANGDMASAAYWIGSQAAKVFAAPSSRVGSIGVWAAHIDASKMFDDIGMKVTLISAGKYKVEGNPFEALGDEAREAKQGEVNAYYDMFAEGVGKARNKRPATVKGGMGEGRMLTAERALDEGLIDGIATLPELLGAIVPRRKGSRSASARARLAIEEANG